jgi:predicted RNA binding protein YcfA (HicA-like mRNA interferase family)
VEHEGAPKSLWAVGHPGRTGGGRAPSGIFACRVRVCRGAATASSTTPRTRVFTAAALFPALPAAPAADATVRPARPTEVDCPPAAPASTPTPTAGASRGCGAPPAAVSRNFRRPPATGEAPSATTQVIPPTSDGPLSPSTASPRGPRRAADGVSRCTRSTGLARHDSLNSEIAKWPQARHSGGTTRRRKHLIVPSFRPEAGRSGRNPMSSSHRPPNQDVRRILKVLSQQGFTVRMNRKNHYRVTSPAGDTVTVPCMPCDPRSLINVRAKLRKVGADL